MGSSIIRIQINLLFSLLATLVLGACSSTVKFQQADVLSGEKIGVFAIRNQPVPDQNNLASVTTQASLNNSEAIRRKLAENPAEILVLKAFMNAFPARTHGNVIPVLKTQVIADTTNKALPDTLATGKKLGLHYFVLLDVKQDLRTTGYQYREQWQPQLQVNSRMVRISDGKVVMSKKALVKGKSFDKYMDSMSSGKGMEELYAQLSRSAVIELMTAVGPVIRDVSRQEKLAHQKLQAHAHIRSLARKDNCKISGELRMEKTIENVVYHVPCRDITLTYACETESENARCWLQ